MNILSDATCRGLALGIALTVYGREEEADTLIEQMTRDQDPILRYGGMYALALAYRGTANNKAIRQLLHFAVSDVSDDVRRTAVLALGFVMYSEPVQVGTFLFIPEAVMHLRLLLFLCPRSPLPLPSPPPLQKRGEGMVA